MNPLSVIVFLAVGAAANGMGGGYGGGYGGGAQGGSSAGGYGGGSAAAGGYGGASSYGQQSVPITSYNRNIQSYSDSTSYAAGNGITNSHNVQVVRGKGGSYDDGYGRMVQTDSSLAMSGSSYYVSPEGKRIQLDWVADEGGFRASGDHLPQPVPLPAEHAQAYREALARVAGAGSYGGSSNYGGSSYGGSADSYSSGASYSAPAVASYGAGDSSYATPAATSYGAPVLLSYSPSGKSGY